MKVRRILYIAAACLLLIVVFVIDVIRKNVELDVGGLTFSRELMIVGAFALFYLFLEIGNTHRNLAPIKKLGLVMIYSVFMILLSMALASIVEDGFDTKNYLLLPLDYWTLFVATFLGILFGVFGILVIRLLRDLVMFKRKKGTRRNFLVFLLLMFAAAASTVVLRPLEKSIFTNILVIGAILFAAVNSFRLSWIVYLTKREKIFGLLYGFFSFGALLALNILQSQSATIGKSLLYYSYPLNEFIWLTTIFANMYFGMAFVSTFFHLPTAEAFDRKTTEVSSLHNLSRLVTQVFDFNELVDTVTSMTLQVCEASRSWLEIIYPAEEADRPRGVPVSYDITKHAGYAIHVAGMRNITQQEIDELLPPDNRTVRDTVVAENRPVVIDDIGNDPRFKHYQSTKKHIRSLVVMPLVSRAGLVGILYATKDTEFGFFKDDVDVISAFADQATVAIENSRLIKESIERERLLREMAVAQEIQKKLLPQQLPRYRGLEIDAISTPAFEVGGDYYDFVAIDEHRLGVVVGDVSGKGVSAAFYMSEVKGIFQSLSRLYPSPREFMIEANNALASSIDKHSFVSLIYAVIDVSTGKLTLARAGHCPLLHLSRDTVSYLRPMGMGLGLSNGSAFASSMEETTLSLEEGDVCVFYTDGLTEARRGDDEFGYERLLDTVKRSGATSASGLKENILETVRAHTDRDTHDDDLTVVVMKWHGQTNLRDLT